MNHNTKTNDFGSNSIIPTCCHQGNLPRIAHKNRIWRRLLRAAKRAGYIIYIAAPLIVAVPVAWLFGKSHPKLEDKVSTFAHHARVRARAHILTHTHTRARTHTHARAQVWEELARTIEKAGPTFIKLAQWAATRWVALSLCLCLCSLSRLLPRSLAPSLPLSPPQLLTPYINLTRPPGKTYSPPKSLGSSPGCRTETTLTTGKTPRCGCTSACVRVCLSVCPSFHPSVPVLVRPSSGRLSVRRHTHTCIHAQPGRSRGEPWAGLEGSAH